MNAVGLDPEVLRSIMQGESVTVTVRVVALVTALGLFAAVFETVRRRILSEDLTPLWIICAAAIMVLAVSIDVLRWFTNLIGAWTPSSTVFFFGLAFLIAISLVYAVKLSTLSRRVATLAQEVALLNADGVGGEPGPKRE